MKIHRHLGHWLISFRGINFAWVDIRGPRNRQAVGLYLDSMGDRAIIEVVFPARSF